MSRPRRITRIVAVPPPTPGFIGPGHLAAQVVSPEQYALNDPFIALMDDRLDIGDRPVGGPHPHAGFETVTLVLEGALRDRDEGGVVRAGEVQWMTAGSGVIHGEDVEAIGRVRLLQLWLTLPRRERWTTPRFQEIRHEAIPIRRENGVNVRVYSGSSGEHRSETLNHVPVTLAEAAMAGSRVFDQELPASYNGFVYVVDGSAQVGDELTLLSAGQVGWIDWPGTAPRMRAPAKEAASFLRIIAGDKGARVVIYAGQPQGHPIVSHGPFVGDSREDIARLYEQYGAGRFVRLRQLARAVRSN